MRRVAHALAAARPRIGLTLCPADLTFPASRAVTMIERWDRDARAAAAAAAAILPRRMPMHRRRHHRGVGCVPRAPGFAKIRGAAVELHLWACLHLRQPQQMDPRAQDGLFASHPQVYVAGASSLSAPLLGLAAKATLVRLRRRLSPPPCVHGGVATHPLGSILRAAAAATPHRRRRQTARCGPRMARARDVVVAARECPRHRRREACRICRVSASVVRVTRS